MQVTLEARISELETAHDTASRVSQQTLDQLENVQAAYLKSVQHADELEGMVRSKDAALSVSEAEIERSNSVYSALKNELSVMQVTLEARISELAWVRADYQALKSDYAKAQSENAENLKHRAALEAENRLLSQISADSKAEMHKWWMVSHHLILVHQRDKGAISKIMAVLKIPNRWLGIGSFSQLPGVVRSSEQSAEPAGYHPPDIRIDPLRSAIVFFHARPRAKKIAAQVLKTVPRLDAAVRRRLALKRGFGRPAADVLFDTGDKNLRSSSDMRQKDLPSLSRQASELLVRFQEAIERKRTSIQR